MDIEIMFHSSSTAKPCKDVLAVYTKGRLLCVQFKDGLLMKYPLCNIFSIASEHQPHKGSTQHEPKPRMVI